jgi:tetratricopeptide (TPR) repeat protein
MGSMFRVTCILILYLAAFAWAQQDSSQNSHPPKSQAPPRSDDATDYPRSSEESSSRSNRVDISPPKDDAKTHPYSSSHGEDDEEGAGDVQEFHPWDPHKAAKDVEVGDFYFKRKNYRAAEDRYREALLYKPNDVFAMYGLGRSLEMLGVYDEARANYEGYLKILPDGPLAPEVHKALDRIKKQEQAKSTDPDK